jgi:23S rRNA pseudouridine955/2504/2580 synthase
MVKESAGNHRVRTETIGSGHAGQRLDNYLFGLLKGVPRKLVYKIIRTGQVRINGGRAGPGARLATGDRVRIPPVRVPDARNETVPGPVLEQLAAAVLFEDADHLLVNKPAGMAVHGGSGVTWGIVDAMRRLRPDDGVELVHRLDRDTSGCLLLAKNHAAMRRLHGQFRAGEPEKRYLCLLDGHLSEPHQLVEQPLLKTERGGERFMVVDPGGKAATTEFTLLQRYRDCSYAEANLLTGRTHQIRAHAAFLGMPLAGDTRYATPARCRHWRELGLRRLFLHAHSLTVRDGAGQPLHFSSPLPDELRAVLDAL